MHAALCVERASVIDWNKWKTKKQDLVKTACGVLFHRFIRIVCSVHLLKKLQYYSLYETRKMKLLCHYFIIKCNYTIIIITIPWILSFLDQSFKISFYIILNFSKFTGKFLFFACDIGVSVFSQLYIWIYAEILFTGTYNAPQVHEPLPLFIYVFPFTRTY